MKWVWLPPSANCPLPTAIGLPALNLSQLIYLHVISYSFRNPG
jgi:hypothetical protein